MYFGGVLGQWLRLQLLQLREKMGLELETRGQLLAAALVGLQHRSALCSRLLGKYGAAGPPRG